MDILEKLKELGFDIPAEKKEDFNKYFRENYKSKAEIDGLKENHVKELQTAKDAAKALQEQLKGFEGIDVKALQAAVKASEEKYNQDIAELRKNAAIDVALAGSGAKDAKLVKALLDSNAVKVDGENISGLSEQLEKIKKSHDYLFSAAQKPEGMKPHSPGNQDDKNGDAELAAIRMGAGLE